MLAGASGLRDEVPEYSLKLNLAGTVLSAISLKIDPTLVESIDHADAGQRMLHSLRPE